MSTLSIRERRIKKAFDMGIDFDKRELNEVIDSLSKLSIDASNSISGRNLLIKYDKLKINKNSDIGLLPLSGFSNKTILTKNENGNYGSYHSDRYGFNNSNKIYEQNRIDIALVGDSWAEGYAVDTEFNIASLLNSKGYKTINLGKAGNGPLFNLASIIEYGSYFKPKKILWIHCENDIFDLINRSEWYSLMKYLNVKDYSQNLITRQDEVDSLWNEYFQNNHKTIKKNLKKSFNYKNTIKLSRLRSSLNINKISEKRYLFKDILKKSDNIISSWGGELYFVYVPNYETLIYKQSRPYREYIIQTVSELNIKVIDILDILNSSNHLDLKKMYPLGLPGHFSKEGYLIATDIIFSKIKN
tara:strand:+ start:159 stop:1232 length:1074 start_codon:yes stop_codon:yes gene_type:complete